MPNNTITKQALIRSFTSSKFPSEKLLPRKRTLPTETCISTICEKMTLSETTVDAIPMTSAEVRVDKKSHKIYPATIAIMDSIKRYVAFFPIVSLPNPTHHPFLTAVNNI